MRRIAMKAAAMGTAMFLLGVVPMVARAQVDAAMERRVATRSITVAASDHVEAQADVADLHVGYTVYGPTLKLAYAAATQSSNAIVEAMVAAGAKRTEIQSQSQQVSRLQDYEIKVQKGMKFSVVQSWTVSVTPKDAALVLDAAVNAGANQSGEITWRLRDSLALDTEAIRKATMRAKAEAAALAEGLGVTLGKPLQATNTTSNGYVGPRPRVYAMAMKAEAPNAAPPPLDIEAQRVMSDATVNVVFAIE